MYAAVTALPVPAFLSANVPAALSPKVSVPANPARLPALAVTAAVVLPLYSLLSAELPLIVNAFLVMVLLLLPASVRLKFSPLLPSDTVTESSVTVLLVAAFASAEYVAAPTVMLSPETPSAVESAERSAVCKP